MLGLSCEADLPDSDEDRANILDGQVAILYYQDSKKIHQSAADLVPFLTVAKEFDFTQQIQKDIIA